MNVVVTPSARGKFTPRELSAAYKDFAEHGPQYLNTETGLEVAVYQFDARVLIVCKEPETDLVVLTTHEEQPTTEGSESGE